MVITQTPLRISFFGGGTDLADFYSEREGVVLSTTINKYIYIIVKQRYDSNIVLNYSEKEIVQNVNDIRHNILREALRMVGIEHSIEITSIGDIPSQGSGLGSSSSFTVGLLNALYTFIGLSKSPYELAERACEIEIEILKEPIGKQDQYAAAFGGFKKYKFLMNGNVIIEDINISDNAMLMIQRNCGLFYTGVTRSASGILSDQKKQIPYHIEELEQLKKLALSSDSAFLTGDIKSLGEKLNDSWNAKKKMSSYISNNKMDEIYEHAMNAGAYGGKLLGAGGGGFFLFIYPQEAAKPLWQALADLRELPFCFTRYGSKVLLNIEEQVFSIV